MVMHRTVWLHPEYGEAVVVWEWKAMEKRLPGMNDCTYYRWTPVVVEFDMFTPQLEQTALMHELAVCKLTYSKLRGCRTPDDPTEEGDQLRG